MSNATGQPAGFLFRLRRMDTPTGISEKTLTQLIELTGLGKTELVHLALRQMANTVIPKYEIDDGALNEEQLAKIRALSPSSDIPDELFTERLF